MNGAAGRAGIIFFSMRSTHTGKVLTILLAAGLATALPWRGAPARGQAPASRDDPPTKDAPKQPPKPAEQEKPAPKGDPRHDPELNDASLDEAAEHIGVRREAKPGEPVTLPPPQPAPGSAAEGAGRQQAPKPVIRAQGVAVARRPREGMFLLNKRGALLSVPTGDVIFVPAPDAKGRAERPMVLLPCRTLEHIETAAGLTSNQPEGRSGERNASPSYEVATAPQASITGQVMVYRDREYLLPTAFKIVPVAEKGVEQAPPEAAEAGTEAAPQAGPQDEPQVGPSQPPEGGMKGEKPSPGQDDRLGQDDRPGQGDRLEQDDRRDQNRDVQDLIRDLESRRHGPRALDRSAAGPGADRKGGATAAAGGGKPAATRPPSGEATPAPGDARPTAAPAGGGEAASNAAPPKPEGTLIVSRRGRVVRVAGRDLALAFDNDTSSAAKPSAAMERPMTLLPCQATQKMEDLTAWKGDAIVLTVTGRVLTYDGRNYLLPTMFQLAHPGDVGPLQ